MNEAEESAIAPLGLEEEPINEKEPTAPMVSVDVSPLSSSSSSADETVNNNDNPAENNYEVKEIIGDRYSKRLGQKEYLIWWKGYKKSEATWEPHENLNNTESIAKYNKKKKVKRLIVHDSFPCSLDYDLDLRLNPSGNNEYCD